jgi:hypothetical protein
VVANILVTQASGDPDGDTKFQLNDESSSQGFTRTSEAIA